MLVKEETGNQNIAIVGAGIIGLAIGLKLQQQGASGDAIRPEWRGKWLLERERWTHCH